MFQSLEAVALGWVRALYEAVGWPGVVFLMAVESANIPFPSEAIMPMAGWFLVQEGGKGPQWTLLAGLYGALGNLVGSWASYALGRLGGRPFLERYGRWLMLTPYDLERADRWFARYGDLAVFLSRLLPVVRTFISFPAGVTRMDPFRFSVYTFAGAYPWSVGLAYGGYLLGEHWEVLRAAMRPFDVPILVAALVLVALFLWRRLRHPTPPQGPSPRKGRGDGV